MTRRVLDLRVPKFLSLLLGVALVASCSEDNGISYCDDHFEFHIEHQNTVAFLDVELSDDGELSGRLVVPSAVFGGVTTEVAEAMLTQQSTIGLQTTAPCSVTVTSVSSSNESLEARFSASCGAENKLSQVDVALLDQLPGLQEIVVVVTTAVTSKRFGISRQCDKPIFRLD